MSAERQRLVGRDEQQGESNVYFLLLDVDQAQRIAVDGQLVQQQAQRYLGRRDGAYSYRRVCLR